MFLRMAHRRVDAALKCQRLARPHAVFVGLLTPVLILPYSSSSASFREPNTKFKEDNSAPTP